MKCPFCGSEMADHLPPVRGRHRDLYNAVAAAGPDGIRREELQRMLFPKNNPTTVRVTVHYTNKEIARIGQRIVSNRDSDQQARYFLIATSTGEA